MGRMKSNEWMEGGAGEEQRCEGEGESVLEKIK